jgi:sec-independent protein translocase protein TatA
MFGGLGVGELVVIVLMLLLLFGAKRIPQIARGLGEGIRNFKADVKEPEQLTQGEEPDTEHEGRRS